MLITANVRTSRLKATGIHFGLSVLLAVLAALLVFIVWYPYPYRDISGGRYLFLLVVAVDVVMGPLLTLTVFNPKKPLVQLRRDLTLIVILQLAALGYGLWTMAVARPVHLVFEIRRFVVVHAVDVPGKLMAKAPTALQRLPWTGPTLLSVREFKNNAEQTDATMMALSGQAVGAQPNLWQSYDKGRADVLAVAKPLTDFKARFAPRVPEIDQALKAVPLGVAVGYVPLAGRDEFWTVFIDMKTAEVLAFVPIDPY